MCLANLPLSRPVHFPQMLTEEAVAEGLDDFFLWTRAWKLFGQFQALYISLERLNAG